MFSLIRLVWRLIEAYNKRNFVSKPKRIGFQYKNVCGNKLNKTIMSLVLLTFKPMTNSL